MRDDKEERLPKKVATGKKMCDAAESVLQRSEIEAYCDVVKAAILAWRKHEQSKQAAYDEVLAAGNELYKLLLYAVDRLDLPDDERRNVTFLMSQWFDTLTADEYADFSLELKTPYTF